MHSYLPYDVRYHVQATPIQHNRLSTRHPRIATYVTVPLRPFYNSLEGVSPFVNVFIYAGSHPNTDNEVSISTDNLCKHSASPPDKCCATLAPGTDRLFHAFFLYSSQAAVDEVQGFLSDQFPDEATHVQLEQNNDTISPEGNLSVTGPTIRNCVHRRDQPIRNSDVALHRYYAAKDAHDYFPGDQ